jgi:alkylhydroperoxidase family enzyme
MTDAHIAMLNQTEAIARTEEIGLPVSLASLNLFRVLLHRPQAAKATADLLLALLFRNVLDDRLRELVIMRIGWVTRSDYEWTQHWTIAQASFGCSPQDLLAVRDWADTERFDEPERAVLVATDETLETGTLCAATLARCRAALGDDDAVIELVLAIGVWRSVSQLTRSLEISLEEDVASWPPDGTQPT